jgi:hypothetical protein
MKELDWGCTLFVHPVPRYSKLKPGLALQVKGKANQHGESSMNPVPALLFPDWEPSIAMPRRNRNMPSFDYYKYLRLRVSGNWQTSQFSRHHRHVPNDRSMR